MNHDSTGVDVCNRRHDSSCGEDYNSSENSTGGEDCSKCQNSESYSDFCMHQDTIRVEDGYACQESINGEDCYWYHDNLGGEDYSKCEDGTCGENCNSYYDSTDSNYFCSLKVSTGVKDSFNFENKSKDTHWRYGKKCGYFNNPKCNRSSEYYNGFDDCDRSKY